MVGFSLAAPVQALVFNSLFSMISQIGNNKQKSKYVTFQVFHKSATNMKRLNWGGGQKRKKRLNCQITSHIKYRQSLKKSGYFNGYCQYTRIFFFQNKITVKLNICKSNIKCSLFSRKTFVPHRSKYHFPIKGTDNLVLGKWTILHLGLG